MHLKKLVLKNFKSHSDSLLEWGLITSLTGGNSCGKTNILRALKLICHHGDWPASWIKYGAESSSIELELGNGVKIFRSRTHKGQAVTIHEPGKDPVTFEGKKDATAFIEQVTGIKKVELDEATGPEDLNFVDVHEVPYLLGGRSDTVQRKVSGIVGANKIDDARNRLNKKVKKLNSRLETLNTEIDSLSPIVTRDRISLNSCKKLMTELYDLDKERNDNANKLKKLKDFNEDIHIGASYSPNVVESITNLAEELSLTLSTFLQLRTELKSLRKLDEELKELEGKSTKGVSQWYNKMHDLRTEYKNKTAEYDTHYELKTQADFLNYEIESANNQLVDLLENLKTVTSEKDRLLSELGICPICQRPI